LPATYDSRIGGLTTSVAIKGPVRVATTANITLSGEQTIDSVAVVAGDRVLVKNQTDNTQNGIYVANSSTWERAKDFDGARDAVTGTQVWINAGTINGENFYRLTTANPVDIGTSAITFTISPGAGTAGPQGDTGPQGIQGEQGVQGATGATGATGAQGPTGATGNTGATGAKGDTGPTGSTGATGATGAQGVKGDKGDVGVEFEGQWAVSTDYAVRDIVYNLGSSYIADAAHTSSAGTEPGVGASWAGTWSYIAKKGDTGATGATGAQGVQGPQGEQGPAGAGTGDMLKSENLSGLADYDAARTNLGVTATADLVTTLIEDSINNGTTNKAPSSNAVFDGLALKAPLISPSFTTPSLGVATATSINGLTVDTTTGGLDVANGATLTVNGSATITNGTHSGTNTGDQTSVTGNAGTATALETARTIGGVSFNGTANIVPATITVADTTDATCSVALFESATGDLSPKTDGGLNYNASNGTLTATAFAGPLTGNVTGNADTVTTNANLTGDVTSSGNATTLATVNSDVGSFTYTSLTVNAKGLITAASSGASPTPTLGYETGSADDTIDATHLAVLKEFTGGTNRTFTITAAATLGANWWTIIHNNSTAELTIDGNSTEVDGLASYKMYPRECRLFQCDGSTIRSIVLTPFDTGSRTTTWTFTKPPGYSELDVRLGGGGASGGCGIAASSAGGGGGGAANWASIPASSVSATETVTIGDGGTSVNTQIGGNAGGNTTFGSLLTAFGGGGGGLGNSTTGQAGGGGGGASSAGAAGTSNSGVGGGPGGGLCVAATAGGGSAFGGGGGGAGAATLGYVGGDSYFGGGGGGGGSGDATNVNGAGGTSVFGGGGGGAGSEDVGPGPGAGGASKFGGAGGAGAFDANTATSGTASSNGCGGGGGGGSETGSSGAGGKGSSRILGVV
jgi:hypothetical protein